MVTSLQVCFYVHLHLTRLHSTFYFISPVPFLPSLNYSSCQLEILLVMVIGLSEIQFRGNRTRNFKSALREVARPITPWIVFHPLLLPLLIHFI